jgi:hypothetical protein
MRQRLQSFFYSRRNLAGMALALGGLTLYAVGILGAPAWIPITLGLYAIGYLLVPVNPELEVRLDAGQDATVVREGLETLLRRIRGKVADDLYARAWRIRESILATLEAEGAENEADPNVYLIRQTALSYLPDAFATYLRMPRAVAGMRASSLPSSQRLAFTAERPSASLRGSMASMIASRSMWIGKGNCTMMP